MLTADRLPAGQICGRGWSVCPANTSPGCGRAAVVVYIFYINCGQAVQLIGASPECLYKLSPGGVVKNHAIAGTIRRGKSLAEDEVLAQELLGSIKDRAEHVMLVDLARNDVNRVCWPETVKVDSLMAVEKFSQVMHLTSQVSGVLREGLTRINVEKVPDLTRREESKTT
ncbi:anthranilate synthase / indole-3-glycerol phosphate synthase [Puccinia graminis f. sp. tritici]|uniref:Anthranilate synthase / indole-3-glycerol phosphate synthase n=1 Tax=Puccinia graminis f. sp. tritici TaxID=56615 RepID=A0A5B0R3K5_PUCGR|nr:anthranilate synthase / indole-3-glycerol phosphate synthase [Puccinia graminis f. sp. tritici]